MLFGYLFLWFAIGTVGNAATLLDTKELDKFDPSNIHVVLVSAIACSEEHAKFGCTLVYAVEADLAHTYHLLIKKGIPSQNIIVFFTDSSHYANYSQPLNSLYNDLNFTKNWRPGLRVDYTARDVTSDNFLAVVQGNETALNCTSCTRRVLKTTKDDHIFIYHEGHGGPGFLVYPYSTDVLTAKSLHSALMSMQSNKKFNQLLINIMACHSGSMLKILGITAARPNENAWAKDCIMVNGSYDFCLNSEMGLAFNVDDTRGDPQHETLEVQYENVHKMVTKSHVMKYGSAAIPTELIAVFEGPNKISFDPTKQKTMIGITKQEPLPIAPIASYLLLKRRLARATSMEEAGRLQRLLMTMEKERKTIQKMTAKMVKRLIKTSKREVQRKIINSPLHEITAVDCHHDVITAFVRECPQFAGSPFVDQFTVPLVNLCEFGINSKKLNLRMKEHCN